MAKVIFTLLFLIFLYSPALAGEITVATEKKLFGKFVMQIKTTLVKKSGWLGVSVYQPGSANIKNYIYPLQGDYSSVEVEIPDAFLYGTYEIVIWNKRIPREQCLPSDVQCQKTGYRLDGMEAYLWGKIKP